MHDQLSTAHTPLRAAFVDVPLIFSSGISQVMYKLALFRRPEKLEMFVVSLDVPQVSMVNLVEETGAAVRHIGNRNILKSAINLNHLVKNNFIDVIVANSLRSYLVCKVASLWNRKPVVYWIHTVNQIHTNLLKKLIFSALIKSDPLIYVSEAVKDNNRPKKHRGKDAVIYNAVQIPEDNPNWIPYSFDRRQEFGIPEDAIVLGYTANFVYYKDHITLLKAFDNLFRLYPNIYLMLIGAGTDYDKTRGIAQEFESKEHIIFLGTRRDARAILGIIDFYVHVSPEEAFGLAVVEAMLASRPTIAARAFALPEIVTDGKTGLLFEPRNVKDLEEKIITLIQNRGFANTLAIAGAQHCSAKFPPEPFAQQVTEFLEDVAHKTT